MKNTLEQCLELNRRIAAGEFTDEQAVAELVKFGLHESRARSNVWILTGRHKEDMPDPAIPSDGEGL